MVQKYSKENNDLPVIGLALSGGGALGAYQVGVLQAIEELGLRKHIKAVAGTSVGSINGAFFVANQVKNLYELWTTTPAEKIFSKLKNHPVQDQLDRAAYSKLIRGLFSQFKVDVTPLKDLLKEQLPEAAVRNANITFLLNIWNVLKFRGESYQLKQIPEGQLADYIIASSSFPLFFPHKVNGQWYLDGGIDINLPLTLPFEEAQVTHVIAADVATFMKYRPKQILKTYLNRKRVTILRPSRWIGSPAHFSKAKVFEQIEIGYQDTMRQLTEWKANLAN